MDELGKAYREIEGEETKPESLPNGKKNKKYTNTDDEIYTSFYEDEDYILEQINNAVHAVHAVYTPSFQYIQFNKHSGSIDTIPCYQNNKHLVNPIDNKLAEQNIVKLPNGVTEYGTTKELIDQIGKFFDKYFEAPSFYADFLPFLILFYWVYDKFPFIPYLHFMGRTGTGKSTAAEVVSSISYKPIDASGAITLASIFRVASQWRGTLFIDEFNPGGDGYQEMLTLLKSGVSDKAVLRIEGEKTKEVAAYVVKSPKIFTSEKPINDSGLRSRVMEIKMERNKRRIPLYRTFSFEKEACEIRNKLLLWRLQNYTGIQLKKIKYGFKELRAFDGRVQQVITPIYYLADDNVRLKVVEFAKEQEAETLRERRESLDGQVFESIANTYKVNTKEMITLSEIFEDLTSGGKNSYLTERKLGNVVRKILGFDIQKQGHAKISTVMLMNEQEKIEELSLYYGTSVPGLSTASTASTAEEDYLAIAEEEGQVTIDK